MLPAGPVVTTPGTVNLSFTCILVSATPDLELQDVSWLINGSTLESDNITTRFADGIGYLTFPTLSLEYDNIAIQCQATQSGIIISKEVVLLLQGNKLKFGRKCSHHWFSGPCNLVLVNKIMFREVQL